MFFFNFDESKKKKCPSCGYIVIPPFPGKCPMCGTQLAVNEASSNLKQDVEPLKNSKQEMKNLITNLAQTSKSSSRQPQDSILSTPTFSKEDPLKVLTKNLTLMANPDIVLAEEKAGKPTAKQIEIVRTQATEEDARIRIKPTTQIKIDLTQNQIDLGKSGEYIKFIGIISDDRKEIFASNLQFSYFLELSYNLNYIATSILKGELDRMILSPVEGENEETCYFLLHKSLIYVIYGNLWEKKAMWLLNQMKTNMLELIGNIDLQNAEKIDFYNISQDYEKRIKFLLQEYVKFQDVFSSPKLISLDNFMRVDYFGLSFQTIGVLSQIITDALEITDIRPPSNNESEDSIQELKEALITAKVAAMAANTLANTGVIPKWISVKLGFQHYRFLIFEKIREYYVSLLAEGNLEYLPGIKDKIHATLSDVIKHPFLGDLKDFYPIKEQIKHLFASYK